MIFLVVAFTSADVAHAFPVNQCAADRFGADLGCTANDVSITGMSVVGDTTSCVGGTSVTLDLQLTVNFAAPDRWDVGIFISGDGKDPQILSTNVGGAASCSVTVLPNSSPFLNLDGGATGDTCGDGNNTIGGGTGSGIHFMPNVTVPCQSLGGAGGNLYIPFVVSWDNQKTSPGAVCTSNADPVPNTKSKCNAPTIVQGSVAIVVLPTLSKTDGKTTLFSGDPTSYTVTISNTTGAALSGAVFKDPAVSGITVNSLVCSASGGASCPASSTVAAMQGAGITIPDMPTGASVAFTIGATLTGSPGDSRSNTATVTVGSQSNSASDTNIIVDSIAILPTTQSKSADKGGTVTYTYTLYNFGSSTDVITLSAVSSRGWTISLSPTSVSVAAGGSTTLTLTMTIPSGAAIGDVDTTTITAISGNNPGKQATATAVTTVTTVLTLVPSNTGAGGAGSSVYYTHRVQNNASTSKSVSLTPVLSGTCTGWSSAFFESDNTTSLTSPVTLTANGGYKDFVLKISIPSGAAALSTCTATLTAAYTSGAANAVSVTDVTTVKNLVLYKDPGYTTESYVYPTGNNVYAKGFGLASGTNYEYRWYNAAGTEVCLPRATSTTGTTFPDTCPIPAAGPLGTWTVQIWNNTANALFVQSNFYVGPDHLEASYSGASPATNTDTIINLALHDRYNHVAPKDSSGNLVIGNPPTTGDPLMVTVTVSGSAQIVSTTLTNAVITGQAVTGKLDSVTGTATLTIRDSIGESVTITPLSYKGVLYGSPVRDEPATVVFIGSTLHHLEIQHSSGTGLTCAASTLIIKACSDAAVPCVIPYTSGVSGTLSATGTPTVNWAGGSAAFSIALGSSSVTKDVQVASAGTVVFGIAATPSPVPVNAASCNFGSPLCTFTSNLAGFIFSNTATGSAYTIPAQISGIATPTLYLRAVQASTTNPAVCTPAIISETLDVNMAYSCNDPASCQPGSLATISNTITGTATAIASGGTSISLDFDANGSAPLTARYDDVGLITLNASKTVTPFAGATAITLNGTSNSFVVKPDHFVLSGIQQTAVPNLANPAAVDATGNKFVMAGEKFSVTVTAVNALGGTTKNYGKETAPESIKITSVLMAGIGLTNNPAVSGTFGAFANGVAIADGVTFLPDGITKSTPFTWNEVGIIKLTPSVGDADYLGAGDVTGTQTGNVGRFYAAKFALTGGFIANRTGLGGVCAAPAGCGTFTYMGEQMSAVFTLTAMAVDGTTTLQNYNWSTTEENQFAKLNPMAAVINGTGGPLGLGAVDSAATRTPFPPCGVAPAHPCLTPAQATAGTFASGVANITVPLTIFRDNANPAGPYALLDIAVAPQDGDGVLMDTYDRDTVNMVAGADNHKFVGQTQARYGRMKISNAHGSELLRLPINVAAQFWNGTTYVTNTLDNNSRFAAIDVIFSNPQKNLALNETSVVTPPASVAFIGGVARYQLARPNGGDGNYNGSLDMNVNSISTYLPSTTARATFGVYKGSNEFIYQRENY